MKVCIMLASAALVLAACSDPSEKSLPPFPAGPHTEEQQKALQEAAEDILEARVKPYNTPVSPPTRSMLAGTSRPSPYEGCPEHHTLYMAYDPDRPTPDKAFKELDKDAKELAKIRRWLTTSVADATTRELYLQPLERMERRNRDDRQLVMQWERCDALREINDQRKQQLLERAKRSLPQPPE